MAIVDSLSAPANNTAYDCNADFHVFIEWTVEHDTVITVYVRYTSVANDNVAIHLKSTTTNSLILSYEIGGGGIQNVAVVSEVFDTEEAKRVDIYGDGTNIIVEVDTVELINETITQHETVAQGYIAQNLTTNDIELESWPLGEPAAGIEFAATVAAVTDTPVGHGS